MGRRFPRAVVLVSLLSCLIVALPAVAAKTKRKAPTRDRAALAQCPNDWTTAPRNGSRP